MSVEGLTMYDMKVFFDLMKKGNTPQLVAMVRSLEHELNTRNDMAIVQMQEVFKEEL